jgi:hypothetical protein
MRKGQAALEFLMTYGWAILVVLAAIAALAYFGVLSPDKFLPNKCTVQGGFSCAEYKIDGPAQLVRVNVQNNLGYDASLVNVILTTSDCTGIAPATAADSYNLPLNNGAKTGLLNFSCNPAASFPTSKFKGDLVITYVQAGQSINHTATGSVTGQVE